MSGTNNSTSPFGNSSSWAPQEPPEIIAIEQSLFHGFMLQMLGFGAYLLIAAASLYLTAIRPTRGKRSWGLTAYIIVLTAGTTIFTATNWRFAELMWINYRGFPGGPAAFFEEEFSFWLNTLSNAAYIFNNFLVDGLLLWRCSVFWNYNWLVMLLPILWFLATTVLSVLTTVQSAQPGIGFFANTIQFAVPYWSLAVAFNIVITLMIVGRLLWMRAKINRALKHNSKIHASVASMMIESAALYSGIGIIFIAGFAREANFSNTLLPFLGEVMSISLLLIILRVASGRSVSQGTFASMPVWNGSQSITTSQQFATEDTMIGMKVTKNTDVYTTSHQSQEVV